MEEIELPRSKKLGKEGKRVAWWSWDMLVKLKGKKKMHGQVSQKEYRDPVWLYRDEVRMAEAKPEPRFVRDAQNKKGPCR